MKGLTVTLYTKTQTGTDAFNQPVFKETAVTVDDVLVGEPSTDDITSSTALYGKQIQFMLGIPKGDTHDWVDKNLKFSSPYEIIRFSEKNNTAGRGYAELLKLMSLCEHFIIANSTFSWWGAFLSENKYKIIISPKPWFQDRSILETDTIDNVKTINLKNDYSSIYESSNILLYDSEFDNAFNFNDSKFFIKNISPKNPNSEIIVKFSLKSNCFNGLRIYYKTKDESEFLEKNSLNLYYYKGETINHSLILPKEAQLDEIMIRPYTLEKEDGDYIGLDSIKIKEISS